MHGNGVSARMKPPPPLRQRFLRAVRLACPRCGHGSLFSGFFRMHEACGRCGLSFAREPGFYLGSIYVNYGVTVIVTGGLYGLLVLGCGLSPETALAWCLAVAVALPILFFRHARSFLLALDSSVNRHQSTRDAATTTGDGGMPSRVELAALKSDDASAGCLMGAAVGLILLFGIGMGAVTLFFSFAGTPPGEAELRTEGIDLR
jgi:uncharacterized protein (DUF983 family)